MTINSKILVLGMVCLMLAGCGKSPEEKVLADAHKGGSKKENPFNPTMPDCAKRDPETRRYLNDKGCTDAERAVFDKQRGL